MLPICYYSTIPFNCGGLDSLTHHVKNTKNFSLVRDKKLIRGCDESSKNANTSERDCACMRVMTQKTKRESERNEEHSKLRFLNCESVTDDRVLGCDLLKGGILPFFSAPVSGIATLKETYFSPIRTDKFGLPYTG